MVQKQPKLSQQEWMDLIQECRINGLSDKDWCEQHHILISSFYNKKMLLSAEQKLLMENGRN